MLKVGVEARVLNNTDHAFLVLPSCMLNACASQADSMFHTLPNGEGKAVNGARFFLSCAAEVPER